MLAAKTIDAFHAVEWTFSDAKTGGGMHGIHPYPAKFIPQIPRTLIALFHELTGGAVLDPFCGSGTTLVECQAAGVQSIGIDLNPIAALISRVKTHHPGKRIAPEARAIVDRARSALETDIPPIPALEHWFSHGAIHALARIRVQLRQMAAGPDLDALRLALSRIIVRISRQESDTRYAAVEREISEQQVYEEFIDSAAMLDATFTESLGLPFRPRAPARVLSKNVMTVTYQDIGAPVGMVICSPPYPNAYEYWLYHKYRMYWLDEDPIAVRTDEIGARPHYFRKNPATPADFERQMGQCFALFDRVLVPRGLVCMVVGRSIIRGVHIDNAALLERAAKGVGFTLSARADRTIPKVKKSFNPSHSTITDEVVLVFSRGR